MARLDIRTFILLYLLALSIPLFIANQSLSDNEVSATLDMALNSSTNWTELRLEGANITGLEVLDPSARINHSENTIRMEGKGETRIKARIRATQGPVKLFLSKDFTGQASAEIKGIGRLENPYQPIFIPISLYTNSSSAKMSLNDMGIKQYSIKNLKGLSSRPVVTEDLINLTNPLEKEVMLDLLTQASFYDEFPTVLLEKGDTGFFWARMGNYVYSNNKTGERTVRNLPVTIDMTSNMTQIFFEGAEISRAEIIQIDNSSMKSCVIGDNFIFLKYGHDGTVFRKANLLLDLNYSQMGRLTIYKNNAGFVGVGLGEKSYFLTNSSNSNSYVSQSYSLGELKGGKNPLKRISVPLFVETTSDWTDIAMEGLEGTTIKVTKVDGAIARPTVSNGMISLRKNASEDTSLAIVEAVLSADRQEDCWIRIEKGNLGFTSVKIGEIAAYDNEGIVKDDPKNKVLYRLPILPERNTEFRAVYNPAAFIFPAYELLKGRAIEDTQSRNVSMSVLSRDLPGQGLSFSIPVANGIRAYVFIAFLVLFIFGLVVLRMDIRIILPEMLNGDDTWKQLEELGRLPLATTIILEALAALAFIPLILINRESMIIWAALIVVYFVLAGAVILRLVGICERSSVNACKNGQAEKESVAILMAATIYIGLFELLKTMHDIGPNISRLLLLVTAAALCFFYFTLAHSNRRSYREYICNLAVSNLESMPISSVVILEALICLAVTPFLMLISEDMANDTAILAYLLLVAGIAVRFVEMKDLLKMDKMKEILTKVLSLAVLPAAMIMEALKLMNDNPGAGQILLAVVIMIVAMMLVFVYVYLRKGIRYA